MQQNNFHYESERKRKKKKTENRLFGVVLLLCAVLCVVAFIQKYNTDNTIYPPYNYESSSDNSLSGNEQNTESNQTENKKWYLTLVNKENPMKDDNGIEIMTLSNGEKIDRNDYERRM